MKARLICARLEISGCREQFLFPEKSFCFPNKSILYPEKSGTRSPSVPLCPGPRNMQCSRLRIRMRGRVHDTISSTILFLCWRWCVLDTKELRYIGAFYDTMHRCLRASRRNFHHHRRRTRTTFIVMGSGDSAHLRKLRSASCHPALGFGWLCPCSVLMKTTWNVD